jgi:hypothetical protein
MFFSFSFSTKYRSAAMVNRDTARHFATGAPARVRTRQQLHDAAAGGSPMGTASDHIAPTSVLVSQAAPQNDAPRHALAAEVQQANPGRITR